MQKIYFSKMHGAGNDFIFIDYKINPAFKIDSDKIVKLCDRRFGIGADGVITIEDVSGYSYRMGYYNADGSTGSLCANGARCSIWFADKTSRLKDGAAKFVSNGVEYSGNVISDELIKFNLNKPKGVNLNCSLHSLGLKIDYDFIDTGSPHVVINFDKLLNSNPGFGSGSLKDFDVNGLGSTIRYADQFKPGGTNVNFIGIDNNEIEIRTYERGVENETLACGTGSVASAVIGYLNYDLKPPITLKTRGGDKLVVNFEIENNELINLSLTGPAKIVFEGSIEEKFFL